MILVMLFCYFIRIELRDERRLENRRAFANIWSDLVYGITLFVLIYFNKRQVALLKITGYKLLNNISDTGKAFLIILITDIFLGYHSESGWQVLVEIILDHYGLDVDEAAITIFICSFPVMIDACVKLWVGLMSSFCKHSLPKNISLFVHANILPSQILIEMSTWKYSRIFLTG
ncbi:hypothetical protein BHE74_00028388 [Ensete ventricosum]|nr:hypothetical protein BHE74_00028388 [Ensete ventricosum]